MAEQSTIKPLMIVHGGAWSIPKELEQDHIDGTRRSITEVYPSLLKGEINAEEAAIRAIKILENDETFDAGKGSFLNLKGQVEMDASIMNGTSLKSGAVCGIQGVRNPICVARMVMNETEHNLLVGENALEFAKEHLKTDEERRELLIENVEELLTRRELEFLDKIRNNETFTSRTVFEAKDTQNLTPPSKRGTVGVVVLDRNGNICAATSTGGTPKKIPGRSGDTGLIGSGTFADSTIAGASSTGWGESIMTIQMTGTLIRWLEFNNVPPRKENTTATVYTHQSFLQDSKQETPKEVNFATQRVIEYLYEKVNGLGGLIVLSKEGNYAVSHNTDKMSFAYVPFDSVDLFNNTFEVVSVVSEKQL